ncbi:hypothetical protein ACDW_32350 [Acidovorax sp. DW039]|nr:hypothetical protein ACDW_32350 [Acidovorax sp. DW039]
MKALCRRGGARQAVRGFLSQLKDRGDGDVRGLVGP